MSGKGLKHTPACPFREGLEMQRGDLALSEMCGYFPARMASESTSVITKLSTFSYPDLQTNLCLAAGSGGSENVRL